MKNLYSRLMLFGEPPNRTRESRVLPSQKNLLKKSVERIVLFIALLLALNIALFNLSAEDKQDVALKEPPPTAKAVIERLVTAINQLKEKVGQIALNKLWESQAGSEVIKRIQQLKGFKREGPKAIQEFLQSQQDIMLDDDRSIKIKVTIEIALGQAGLERRQGGQESLRTILLDILYDMMNDPVAKAASLDILKNTSSGYEVLVTARNLEKISPRTYRSDAIKAASKILEGLPDSYSTGSNTAFNKAFQVLHVLGYYEAKEAIPQIEAIAKKYPNFAYQCLKTLYQFPVKDQVDVFQRLIADEKTRLSLADCMGTFLGGMDFQDNSARQLVRNVFAKLSDQQVEQFLLRIDSGVIDALQSEFMKPVSRDAFRAFAPSKSRIQGSLQLLKELEPQLKNTALEPALEKARTQLQGFLKNEKQLKNAR